MSKHRFRRIRRFRFNLPQRVAAGLLALFVAQAAWLICHPTSGFSHAGVLAGRLEHLPLLPPWLPFLGAGVMLGGALWWVTRRLFGNLGGYMALALYCFSPAVLQASAAPNDGILVTLSVYGCVYTCIGVAHAMQGPRRKWRPRIVMLALLFAAATTAHGAAFPAALLLGLGLMLWVAEGRRGPILPVMLIALGGAMLVALAVCGFSLAGFASLLRWDELRLGWSFWPAVKFFGVLPNLGISLASLCAVGFYAMNSRSRFFGNTAPLLCVLFLLLFSFNGASEGLWALPFLLTFVGGVFADACEGPRRGLAMGAAGVLAGIQVACCMMTLAR
jgi:hypothetical protein